MPITTRSQTKKISVAPINEKAPAVVETSEPAQTIAPVQKGNGVTYGELCQIYAAILADDETALSVALKTMENINYEFLVTQNCAPVNFNAPAANAGEHATLRRSVFIMTHVLGRPNCMNMLFVNYGNQLRFIDLLPELMTPIAEHGVDNIVVGKTNYKNTMWILLAQLDQLAKTLTPDQRKALALDAQMKEAFYSTGDSSDSELDPTYYSNSSSSDLEFEAEQEVEDFEPTQAIHEELDPTTSSMGIFALSGIKRSTSQITPDDLRDDTKRRCI